jgi:hypothetical protein
MLQTFEDNSGRSGEIPSDAHYSVVNGNAVGERNMQQCTIPVKQRSTIFMFNVT